MENEKVKTIDWHIHLPMDFPTDWDDERSEYMEQTITLTTSKSGDWQILEINGIEWASGHSISNVDWLGLLSEHFNCQIEVIWISDEEMEARC